MLTNESGILKRLKWFSSAAMASVVAAHWCLFAGTSVVLGLESYQSDSSASNGNGVSEIQNNTMPNTSNTPTDQSETHHAESVLTGQDVPMPHLPEIPETEKPQLPEIPETEKPQLPENLGLITDHQNQIVVAQNLPVATLKLQPNSIPIMDSILRILINDSQIQRYVQYWHQVMSNISSRDLSNIKNNQESTFYLLVANQESVSQPLTLSYKENIAINYEVLKIPGSLTGGYNIMQYFHPLSINDHTAGVVYDLYTVSMQWVNPMENSWTLMLGSQWSMSRNMFADALSALMLKSESVGMGVDMMLHFQSPKNPFFFFSRSGISSQRQNITTSSALFDNDVDKNKSERSYFLKANIGAGYVISTGKSQDVTATFSLGLAYLKNNEYQIHWDKIYNLGLINGVGLDDLARKDWSVRVKGSHFSYVPVSVSLQWKKQNFHLTKEKKLAGISPQISIGASWNILNVEKNKYEVEFLGKWSELDNFASKPSSNLQDSLYRNISASVSRKLPEMSKWMIHAEMSVHFSTEVVPDAKLGLIISMNDKAVKYIIEMVMSFEM